MTFDDIPAGVSIFLDANPLVYHFAPDPVFGAACGRLLTGIANNEFSALTSTHVLSEVAHHLMTLEATSTFQWPSKIVQRLKHNPAEIGMLSKFRTSIDTVLNLPIQVSTVQPTGSHGQPNSVSGTAYFPMMLSSSRSCRLTD